MLVKLKELLNIKNGKDRKGLNKGEIPVIGTGGIMTYVNEFLYDKEAILLPRKGSLNNVMYIDKPFRTVDTMFYAIPDAEKVNGKFLYYYLSLINFERYDLGSTIPSMTAGLYYTFEVNIPERKIQNKIADLLTKIDNQIERNNKMVQSLQVLGKSVFSKTFKDEKSYCSLTEFPYINFLKPGIDKFSGEKRYLATAEVVNDEINYEADKIDYENRESRANMQPIHNSIRFAKMKASIKHIFITEKEDLLTDNYIFSTGFCGVKCEPFVLEYMINYIELPYFEIMKDKLAHGATQQAVNNEDLKSMKIAIPTKEKLETFHESTKDIYEQIIKIKESNVKLTRLKNNLLPLLINGQLK